MKDLSRARENAKEIINKSEEFIVISPNGASTYCGGKAHLMAMLCIYLRAQKEKNILDDEEIDEVVRVAKLDLDDVEDELDKQMKELYSKIEKMDSKEFLDLLKDVLE